MSALSKRKALLAIIEALKYKLKLSEGYNFKDFGEGKLLIIIHDAPFINVQVQKIIIRILEELIIPRVVNIVGIDGAYGGDVNTDWMAAIHDENMRTDIMNTLLEEGRLTGLERRNSMLF